MQQVTDEHWNTAEDAEQWIYANILLNLVHLTFSGLWLVACSMSNPLTLDTFAPVLEDQIRWNIDNPPL